ncbi:hypothetical protein Rhal01_01438 [Rubritalea halochordaticola]|uniref:DUF455 family protein n=1 Tax=Rubritalea halochordaticola TaxID=714537 RepID=A0ABP9UXS6_9BACT
MELREFAERVLYSESLEEKLLLNPREITDLSPDTGFSMPSGPGRPSELRISEKGVKADFPGLNRLDDDVERGKMLHFLANHELLATELMALVLLKFPNAPKEFRMGVFETLKEEQAHTLMYMRRMRECGVEFGELPVNDYFWRVVAPMESPMDFVSRLSLVFEQANLDYSVFYAKLFRQVGDNGTARVLEKIYEDEIGHVGHGLKWFRKWKKEGDTDWESFKKQLYFPLSLVRAKGVAPYNAEGRLRAGLDPEWVEKLEIEEQSRGRTPVIHWFNPNVEGEVLAQKLGKPFQPKRNVVLLEEDLDVLPIAWARRDDVVLVNKMPSRDHLKNLRKWGFAMPEFVVIGEDEDLKQRRIGGLRPWAWGGRASLVMKEFSHDMSSQVQWKWRENFEDRFFSKQLGVKMEELLGGACGQWLEDENEVFEAVQAYAGNALMKAPFSAAGRGHCRVIDGEWTDSMRGWLRRVLSDQGGVVVEPWLDRVMDFSSQYEVKPSGEIKHIGMVLVLNDDLGRFRGIEARPRWSHHLDEDLKTFLFRDADVTSLYKEKIPEALAKLLGGADFVGPIGIDAMVYRDKSGNYVLRPVVEVNSRITMGRVALELLRKTASGLGGRYEILRKSQIEDFDAWLDTLNPGEPKKGFGAGDYIINDPSQAEEFLALWRVS